MSILKIINIIIFFILIVLGIETIIKFKKNEGKLIKEVRKTIMIRINIIIILTVLLAIVNIVNIILSIKPDKRDGIENYNKSYYITEYGNDLDSNLSIFPDNKEILIEPMFESSMLTSLFDTDGYIILKTKFTEENFNNEINRLKSLSMDIKSSYYENAETYTNNIRFDDKSYKYPAYITIDGFDSTYEYALINENDREIIYVYLSYPDINNSMYKDYLKLDLSEYSKTDTLSLYSMYSHSFDNGRTYMEFDDSN